MKTVTDTEKAVAKLARKWHAGQKRKFSGQDYVTHPIHVAKIYKVLELSDDSDGADDIANISIAYLHDIFEETAVTPSEFISTLTEILPIEKARHVFDGVTSLTNVYTVEKFTDISKKERVRLESERIALLPEHIIKIKCCDIMHNMSDIHMAPFGEASQYIVNKTNMFNIISRSIRDQKSVVLAATHAVITTAALNIGVADEPNP